MNTDEKISKPKGGKRKGAGRKAGIPNKGNRDDDKVWVAAYARKCGREAIDKLVHIMHHGKSDNAQIAASVAILDCGYGKPVAQLDVSVTSASVPMINNKKMTLEEAAEAYAETSRNMWAQIKQEDPKLIEATANATVVDIGQKR
jgi:hypothetical protein